MNANSARRSSPATIQAIVLLTSFFAMLNETSINVALTDLMEIFGTSVSTIQWLVTGFMLVMSVVVPVTAFIIQSFKDRHVYFVSLGLLVIGSLVAIFAGSFPMLLIGRLIQAAGTCVLMSLTVNIMLTLSASHDRGKAMGLIGLVTLFAPAVAPSLGGMVLQFMGWQWMFILPLGLFVIIGIIAALKLEDVTPMKSTRFDLPSFIYEVIAFGGLLYAVTGLSESGNAISYIVAAVAGVAGLALFIHRQLTMEDPLLDLRIFAEPMFTFAMITVFLSIVTVFGMTVLLPMLYIQAFALPAALAGLSMLPGGVLNGLTAPVFGKLYDARPVRLPLVIAAVVILISALTYAFLPVGTPLAAYIVVHIIALLAVSLVMTFSQANGMNHVAHGKHPHATAALSTIMQLGGGFGAAIYTALYATGLTGSTGSTAVVHGFGRAFLVGAIIYFIPVVLAFRTSKAGAHKL